MRKNHNNKKMIFLALLITLTVMTSAFIWTLARYVTSRTVSDGAKVATFGLDIPNTIALFSDSYINVNADTPGKKIIAPGTSGQYRFQVIGTSEVAYKVSADVSVTYSDEWNGYKPLQFSLDGNEWKTWNLFKEDLRKALESNDIPPNTEYTSTQTLYWQWPFQVSSENDILDTAMGVAAAKGPAPTVTVEIEVTAAQID